MIENSHYFGYCGIRITAVCTRKISPLGGSRSISWAKTERADLVFNSLIFFFEAVGGKSFPAVKADQISSTHEIQMQK